MNPNIKVIPFPGIKNAYVVISGCKSNLGNQCEKRMSFLYATKEGGAEWEPNFGPITKLTPCNKDHESAEPHWFYDFYTGQSNWSQCAVDEVRLPEHFLSGNYVALFAALKEWAS